MSDNIHKQNFNPKFSQLEKLESELNDVISNYDGEISLAAAIGVLDMVKFRLLVNHAGD